MHHLSSYNPFKFFIVFLDKSNPPKQQSTLCQSIDRKFGKKFRTQNIIVSCSDSIFVLQQRAFKGAICYLFSQKNYDIRIFQKYIKVKYGYNYFLQNIKLIYRHTIEIKIMLIKIPHTFKRTSEFLDSFLNEQIIHIQSRLL